MQIKDSKSGTSYSDIMELVWDDERKEYVLAPIKEGRQMTIFDIDSDEEQPIEEVMEIEAREVLALPEPDDEAESTDDEEDDEEDEGDGVGSRAAFEKARQKLSGMNDPDDYEYDDPEEEE